MKLPEHHSERAADLRSAVVEAVKAGADLEGAELADAYLACTGLDGARLAGAWLTEGEVAGVVAYGHLLGHEWIAHVRDFAKRNAPRRVHTCVRALTALFETLRAAATPA